MDDAPFGLIELLLAFGLVIGWAVWDTVRTRRDLARARAKVGK